MAENNENLNNVNDGADNNDQQTAQTKGVVSKAIHGVKHVVVKAKATKTGRVVITLAKGALVGLGLYESYQYGFKKGQSSVQPTVITITEGCQEEAPAEETQAEEATEVSAEEETV